MTKTNKSKKGQAPMQPVQSKRAKKRANQAKNAPAMSNPGQMASVGVAQGKTKRTARPKMTTLRNGDCHIVHREYIQDLLAQASSPSTFNVAAALAINPGLSATFPWLSKIAANFESYRFSKLKFCYETEAPSSLGGTQVLAVDYDASDVAPTTKQQALAYRDSVRSPPWQNCTHNSLKEDLSKQKTFFVRYGAQPANTDIKLYDTGNLFAINQGVTTGGAVTGELYVEYDVLLMTPLYEPIATVAASGGMTTSTATLASPLLAGVASGSLPITQSLTTVTVNNLVVGQEYLVSYVCNGAGVTMTFGTPVGWTQKTALGNGLVNSATVTYTATATTASLVITASGAPSTAYFSVAAFTTAF
jgi:hypothetical protein